MSEPYLSPTVRWVVFGFGLMWFCTLYLGILTPTKRPISTERCHCHMTDKQERLESRYIFVMNELMSFKRMLKDDELSEGFRNQVYEHVADIALSAKHIAQETREENQ